MTVYDFGKPIAQVKTEIDVVKRYNTSLVRQYETKVESNEDYMTIKDELEKSIIYHEALITRFRVLQKLSNSYSMTGTIGFDLTRAIASTFKEILPFVKTGQVCFTGFNDAISQTFNSMIKIKE